MKILRYITGVMALLLVMHSSHAQAISNKEATAIDSRLVSLIGKIGDLGGGDFDESNMDSLDNANYRLLNYLRSLPAKGPSVLNLPLNKTKKSRLSVTCSDDKKLCLFDWDTWQGGTMRKYENVAIYSCDNKAFFRIMRDTTVEQDFGCYYNNIQTIKTSAGKTVYLVFEAAVASTKDRYAGIRSFVIENGSLKSYPLFKTKTKTLDNIGYGYDAFASDFNKKKISEIHLDDQHKRLYIPIINGEVVTNKYLVYVFDGDNYVFDKNAK